MTSPSCTYGTKKNTFYSVALDVNEFCSLLSSLITILDEQILLTRTSGERLLREILGIKLFRSIVFISFQ